MKTLRNNLVSIAVVLAIFGAAYLQAGILEPGVLPAILAEFRAMVGGFRPDLEAFRAEPAIVQVHTAAALGALAAGVAQLIGPKGALPHRALGYAFVALMLVTAGTALFIRQANDGNFSALHVFVPLTFMGLFGLVANARSGNVREHRSAAVALFFAALILPGLFAFMPGRLMWAVLFGG